MRAGPATRRTSRSCCAVIARYGEEERKSRDSLPRSRGRAGVGAGGIISSTQFSCIPMTAITADIPYTPATSEKLVNETFGPENIHRRKTGPLDPRPMSIENGRPLAREFTLDRNGFEFVGHKTAVRNFFDKPSLESEYYPEVEQLIKQASGAAR